jgi:hypothetical protein
MITKTGRKGLTMPLTQSEVYRAIQELDEIVSGGGASADHVPGATPARRNDSYFVETDTAFISLKSIARLAYIRCRLIWDKRNSADIAREFFQRFDVVVVHDESLEEGPKDQQVVEDIRDRTRRAQALARINQANFRSQVLHDFGSQCALSGCDQIVVLEACHIIPFAEDGADSSSNGLLLRADLHRLFDNGLLAVCPETWQWRFCESLEEHYEDLSENRMDQEVYVQRVDALRRHWSASQLGGNVND